MAWSVALRYVVNRVHEADHDKLGVRHVLHEEDTAGQEELSVRLRASECAITMQAAASRNAIYQEAARKIAEMEAKRNVDKVEAARKLKQAERKAAKMEEESKLPQIRIEHVFLGLLLRIEHI